MGRMRQVGVPRLRVAEGHEKAVGEALGEALGADVRAPLEVRDLGDLPRQAAESLLDLPHLRRGRAVLPSEKDDVADQAHGTRTFDSLRWTSARETTAGPASGSRIVNSVPRRGSDATSTLPPCPLTIRCT